MSLRSKLIRLAYAQPSLREDILPLLKEADDAGTLKWAKLTKEEAYRTFKAPRESYIPKDNPTLLKLHTPPGLEIYRWETTKNDQTPLTSAIAFAGKADKPLWYHMFTERREPDLQALIKRTISDFNARMDVKKQRQEQRRNFQHGIQAGDIFYASWGYDQTNIDWYQVTDVVGKSVIVREIAGHSISEGQGSDRVVPVPNKFTGPPMKKIPQGLSGSGRSVYIKISDVQTAFAWDGKPKHQTSSGWGH